MAARLSIWRSAPATLALALALATLLAACGGGKEDSRPPRPGPKCAVPRQGTDPFTGQPYPDVQGTVADEKTWLRAFTDELYLWYAEVPQAEPTLYLRPVDYFEVLKTPLLTASGKPKDRFHYSLPTAFFQELAQSGVQAGYGVEWEIRQQSPPREIVAAFTQAGSPAAAANITRGTRLLSVDGVDVAMGSDVATLNAGTFPTSAGQTHTLTLQDREGATRTVALTSANVQNAPVHTVKTLATENGLVGYMLFNDHLATAEAALVAAIEQLKSAAVTDLVLDLRYNGGGLLDIAGELAFMIAGPTRTTGKAFELVRFNDKHPTVDPVTGEALEPTPFHAVSRGFSVTAGRALPSLDLNRVFVLTGEHTCSASESIINGLRGVDVTVIQIGGTTCGKPYGFYPLDNCGTTYFSIQLEGVNAKGFGDYADGFTPGSSAVAGVPGCLLDDDFAHELGDENEALLAAALGYRASGTCPTGANVADLASRTSQLRAGDSSERLSKPFWRELRTYRR